MAAGFVVENGRDTDRIANVEYIYATIYADFIKGDAGDNGFSVSFGEDTINGGDGSDTIEYGYDFRLALDLDLTIRNPGIDADLQRGTIIDLGGRTDTVKSIENVTGSVLDDMLRGNFAVNGLDGGRGDDLLSGRGGNDVLDGGFGRDDLFGGAGNDWLAGGSGNDFLHGGAGADRFVFGTPGDRDMVDDFRGGFDKVDVTAFDFANGTAVLARAEQHGTSVVVDLDGDTAIELAQTALGDLSAGDFLV